MRALILGIGDAFTTMSYGASAVIEGPRGLVLLDCPDLIHRALKEASDISGWDVDCRSMDEILLTHLHGDHCTGLESFGFKRAVYRLRNESDVTPRLYTHPGAADRLWERLAPAMDAPFHEPGKPSELADFYDLRTFAIGEAFEVAGLTVEARTTIHPIPTVGFRISDGVSTLAWSGDTAFDQDHIDWMSGADLIVHETNLGPAHTNVNLLNALPDDLRAKMRLTHIMDEFDPASSDIPVLRTGEVLDTSTPAPGASPGDRTR